MAIFVKHSKDPKHFKSLKSEDFINNTNVIKVKKLN